MSSHAWPSTLKPLTDWLTATPEMLALRPVSGADRAGVVHRTTDVRARVDARHDQVERCAERAQASEHHAQCREAR